MPKRHTLLPIACAALALVAGPAAHGQEAEGQEAQGPLDQFFAICGGNGAEAMETLPGETVERADAPAYFESDLRRTEDHRVTKFEDGYAMRAVMQGGMDANAIIVKCAFASNAIAYDDAFEALSQATEDDLMELGTEETGKRSTVISGSGGYQLFEERDGWLSIYRLDVMISARNLDPEYLKEGAQPVRVPSAN